MFELNRALQNVTDYNQAKSLVPDAIKELDLAESRIKKLEDAKIKLDKLLTVATTRIEQLESLSIDKFEEWVKIDQSCSLCKLHDDCNNFDECMIKHTIRVLNYYKEHVLKGVENGQVKNS